MLEAGFDITFSREEILSLCFELSKDRVQDSKYVQAIYDYTEVLLSYFEKNK